MSDDLNARVDDIIEQRRTQTRPPSDLYITATQTRAALRRLSVARAPVQMDNPAAMMVQLGDASQAVLSLYLGASAAQRWCRANDNAGPLGDKRLAELVATLTDLRHAVMHWDKKGGKPDVFLAFGDHDILAHLPQGRKQPTVIAGMPWSVFERAAIRLERWASAHLGIESAT